MSSIDTRFRDQIEQFKQQRTPGQTQTGFMNDRRESFALKSSLSPTPIQDVTPKQLRTEYGKSFMKEMPRTSNVKARR